MAARAASRIHRAMLIAAAVLLAGCAGSGRQVYSEMPTPSPHAAGVPSKAVAPPTSQGQRIARIAEDMVGTPYRYGGAHPAQGFDCSGLVFFTHRQVNLSIPRTSGDQYRAARPVSLQQAQPGDLVFFTDQRKLSHVGIYVGDQRFVHAPASGRRVVVARLDAPYYREHLVGLGRLY